MSQTDEVIATLRLDSKEVGTTDARPAAHQSWDQRFSIELDRVSYFRPIFYSILFPFN